MSPSSSFHVQHDLKLNWVSVETRSGSEGSEGDTRGLLHLMLDAGGMAGVVEALDMAAALLKKHKVCVQATQILWHGKSCHEGGETQPS